ncbi:hypothetical protein PDESU_05375 [Pontiella desulfatans]|uniref:DUF432 domain-containing protein n=2 Tax=Pontiella desulfatans TaxID=2750659 RepID=A0A6C2UA98_PONDE|nr:hypothetical protein PDESU_05375 [Pontiella desulfatans]
MLDYSKLWAPHALERNQTLEFAVGPLLMRIHRGMQDWYVAHESVAGGDERCFVRTLDEPLNPDNEWTRWIIDEGINSLRFLPRLPDRPIIVRPEMPISLMPRQSVQFFIGIPLWIAVVNGARQDPAVEIPTMTLSNSWFGPTTEGELCYALKTTAKRHLAELLPHAHRAVFPLEVRNASSELLKFERLCLRPQYLNVFQGATRLWTSKGRVSYRGEENWSRIVYASGAPEYDRAGAQVGSAREAMRHGALLKTFDNLIQKVELP